MKAIVRRLHKLETRAMFPAVGVPRNSIRVVVQPVCGPLNLAASKCKRMISENGILTEYVELDGIGDGLSREAMDRFVASFPVERIGSAAR
jgi:hypothetical protein